MNRGKSAVYIYTPLILLTGLITDCSPLVLIRLIMNVLLPNFVNKTSFTAQVFHKSSLIPIKLS